MILHIKNKPSPATFVPKTDPALASLANDRDNRQRWAATAAAIFSQWPLEAIHACVSAGEDEFIRNARTHLSGHMFKQGDYKYMFRIIKRTAQLNPLGRPFNRRPDPVKVLLSNQ